MPAIATFGAGSAKAYGNLKFRPFPARYYILQILDVKNASAANSVQISEFNIMNGASRLASSSYYNWNLSFPSAAALSNTPDSPVNEEPYRANDALTNTKWLDFRSGAVVYNSIAKDGAGLWIDLGSVQDSTGYQWYTANDAIERDPKSWTVWVSQDDKTWFLASQVNGFIATDSRFTLAGSWDWIK
jgi:hypothetical protein